MVLSAQRVSGPYYIFQNALCKCELAVFAEKGKAPIIRFEIAIYCVMSKAKCGKGCSSNPTLVVVVGRSHWSSSCALRTS